MAASTHCKVTSVLSVAQAQHRAAVDPAVAQRGQRLAVIYGDEKRTKEASGRASLGKAIADQTVQLRKLRLQMPARFEDALQFPQLTGRVPAKRSGD